MSSRLVTLEDLKTRALDYADMTGTTFPVTARLEEYVNDALSEVYDMLVSAYADYFHKSTTVTLVAGTEGYDLPLGTVTSVVRSKPLELMLPVNLQS